MTRWTLRLLLLVGTRFLGGVEVDAEELGAHASLMRHPETSMSMAMKTPIFMIVSGLRRPWSRL
jgi:hypothetical protein